MRASARSALKKGSHHDLPITLLMAAVGAIPSDALSGFTVLGELGLDGSVAPVAGILPAAIGANARSEGLICPAACGAKAAWASPEMEIIAASSLIQLVNHFRGTQVLSRPQPKIREVETTLLDLADIKGQESAKRALEVAAAARVARARPAGRTLCRVRTAADPHQCAGEWFCAGRRREAGQDRPHAFAGCCRRDAAVSARLSPRAARCAHARRSRWRGQCRPHSSGEAFSYRGALSDDFRRAA